MLVLYNNMLQSLFRSQVLTLGAVFLAIFGMFVVLFRSFRLALTAIVPNLVSAVVILGLIGWLGIPLDLMTITIAAITVGIAVDDTIHYIHRFLHEFQRDDDYWAAIHRCSSHDRPCDVLHQRLDHAGFFGAGPVAVQADDLLRSADGHGDAGGVAREYDAITAVSHATVTLRWADRRPSRDRSGRTRR